MTKKNVPTHSTPTQRSVLAFPANKDNSMPISRILSIFTLTLPEYFLLQQLGASEMKPSDSTASQRRALRQLEALYYVRMSPRTESWVLSELGETVIEVSAILLGADVKSAPAKLLSLPGA
jgi:hypothetical protein